MAEFILKKDNKITSNSVNKEPLKRVVMENVRSQEVSMNISVIIPTYNEEKTIVKLIRFLLINNKEKHVVEVIVADGNSTDNTIEVAEAAGAKVVQCPAKGRAAQLNFAAQEAKGDILYFLHPGSIPPATYSTDIMNANLNRYHSGCYRLCFDCDHWFLKLNSWLTQFNFDYLRFGDQSLFVTKEAFRRAGGFDESLVVMEDQEIIKRIKRYARFRVFEKAVTASARKYLDNGIYKVHGFSIILYMLYKFGASQRQIEKVYRLLVKQERV